jgi:hypothetical protein
MPASSSAAARARFAGRDYRAPLRWSNFEKVQPDYCLLTLAAEIRADDGAVIQFDSRGFALSRTASTWSVASAVRFVVDDARYRWLQELPAVWEGEFDATSGSARYRAYIASYEL